MRCRLRAGHAGTLEVLGAVRADRRRLVLGIASTLRHPSPVAVAASAPRATTEQWCLRRHWLLPHDSIIYLDRVRYKAPNV